MKTTIMGRAAALALLGLLGTGVSAWADPAGTGAEKGKDEKKVEKIEKRRVVIVGPDGKERVLEGPGPMVRRGYLGIGLTELTPDLRTHFGVPEDAGVMVSHVEPGGPADKAGVKVGDIIARVDGHDIASSWDLRAQVRELDEGQQVPLEVWRNGKAQNLSAAVTLRERPEMDMAPFFIRGGEEGGPVRLRFHEEIEGHPTHREMPHPAPAPRGERDIVHFRNERSPRERLLEQRLKDLEKRIGELEQLLEKKGN